MNNSETLEEKHERNRRQRYAFIKEWAAYVRTHPDDAEDRNPADDAEDRSEDQQQVESTIQITQWGECDVFISYAEQRDSLLLDVPYPFVGFGRMRTSYIGRRANGRPPASRRRADRERSEPRRKNYGRPPTDESLELQRQQLHSCLGSLPEACGSIAYKTIALSNLQQFRADHERAHEYWTDQDHSSEMVSGLDALEEFIDVLIIVERAIAHVRCSDDGSYRWLSDLCDNPQEVVEAVEQALDQQSAPTGIFSKLRNVAKRVRAGNP